MVGVHLHLVQFWLLNLKSIANTTIQRNICSYIIAQHWKGRLEKQSYKSTHISVLLVPKVEKSRKSESLSRQLKTMYLYNLHNPLKNYYWYSVVTLTLQSQIFWCIFFSFIGKLQGYKKLKIECFITCITINIYWTMNETFKHCVNSVFELYISCIPLLPASRRLIIAQT